MNKKILITLIIALVIILVFIGIWYLLKSSPAKEEVRQREKIGVGITSLKPEVVEQYQAVVDYLNKHSDDDWYLVPLKDYGSFISQMELGQINAGFMGSAVGYQMIKKNLVLPVARGEKDGVSVYYGYIFTRKDGGLNKIEDLKDKKFAYVDIYTSAEYLFPRYFLRFKGYDPDDFFKVSSFLGSHEGAIQAVLDDQFDAGAAKDSAWRRFFKDKPELEKELQILAQRGKISGT